MVDKRVLSELCLPDMIFEWVSHTVVGWQLRVLNGVRAFTSNKDVAVIVTCWC